MRRITLAAFLISFVAIAPLHASEGGGGGGGGGEGGGPMAAGGPVAGPRGVAPPVPGANPGGVSTLPGGATIALSGPPGNRDVTVTTGSGRKLTGKHIRTTRNAQTGITTVWIRNPDGTRTGYHVDKQGNESVSNHKR